jgi:hypothetical protein
VNTRDDFYELPARVGILVAAEAANLTTPNAAFDPTIRHFFADLESGASSRARGLPGAQSIG